VIKKRRYTQQYLMTASKPQSSHFVLRHDACSSRKRPFAGTLNVSRPIFLKPEPNTILVVDDDVDTREAWGEFLTINGYTVVCAENGQAALDQISTWPEPPLLIVLDMLMPVMDGRTFMQQVRRHHRLKDVPIIVTTSEPRLSANLLGAAAILTKPVTPTKFFVSGA
jgi:two-component system chemotaxis response regulator CheY